MKNGINCLHLQFLSWLLCIIWANDMDVTYETERYITGHLEGKRNYGILK